VCVQDAFSSVCMHTRFSVPSWLLVPVQQRIPDFLLHAIVKSTRLMIVSVHMPL